MVYSERRILLPGKLAAEAWKRLSPAARVLGLSGVLGLLAGCLNATFQVSVETGQVLAGIVTYPPDSSFFMYHVSAFSLVNHLSALLVWITNSEIVSSVIISGIVGMVSFQALGLLIYVINRDIHLSILCLLLIYFMDRTGSGQVYPTALLGYSNTYGILGLSFALLVVALFAAEAWRPAFFCLGLLPAIHISWALWTAVILGAAATFDFARTKELVKKNYPYFLAGFAVSLGALAYQLRLMQAIAPAESQTQRRYIEAYVKYWDQHRRPFFLDRKTGRIVFFTKGVVDVLYSMMLSILSLFWFRKDEKRRFLFRLLATAGGAALVLGAFTHIRPSVLPSFFLVLMPGRYVNLNIITVSACFLGILTCRDHRSTDLKYHVFLTLWASYVLSRSIVESILWPLNGALLALWSAYIASLKFGLISDALRKPARRLSAVTAPLRTLLRKGSVLWPSSDSRRYRLVAAAVVAALFFGRAFSKPHFVENRVFKVHLLRNRSNDPFFAAVSKRRGMMLIGGGEPVFMASLKTRRPILVPVESANFVPYIPNAADPFNRLLKLVYGLDITGPPPKKGYHNDILPLFYEELWKKRTTEEWQEIRRKTGVSDILTVSSWKLALPVVAEGNGLVLYEIPPAGDTVKG